MMHWIEDELDNVKFAVVKLRYVANKKAGLSRWLELSWEFCNGSNKNSLLGAKFVTGYLCLVSIVINEFGYNCYGNATEFSQCMW